MNINKVVGSNIQKIRTKRGMTQDELANKLSITRITLSKIERGQQNITLNRLYDISLLLGVNIIDLFPTIDNKNEIIKFESIDYLDKNSELEILKFLENGEHYE